MAWNDWSRGSVSRERRGMMGGEREQEQAFPQRWNRRLPFTALGAEVRISVSDFGSLM